MATSRATQGRGVLRAVEHINGDVASDLRGRDFASLADFDEALIKLDGTANKERIGANAIIGVSMAGARAFAESEHRSLWRSLSPAGVEPRLPVPHFNIINGGAHAQNGLDFQEFMIAPLVHELWQSGSCRRGDLQRPSRGTPLTLSWRRTRRRRRLRTGDQFSRSGSGASCGGDRACWL